MVKQKRLRQMPQPFFVYIVRLLEIALQQALEGFAVPRFVMARYQKVLRFQGKSDLI